MLNTLLKLKASRHDPEAGCYALSQTSGHKHPEEVSKRPCREAKPAEHQHNELSDIEVPPESSHQSDTTYASTQSPSNSSNISAEADNSLDVYSDLSSEQSIVRSYDLQELEKGFVAAPRFQLNPTQNEDWEVIRTRLDDALQHLFEPTPGQEYILTREFWLAGEAGSALAPTVIIICGHESYKSQLLKILKNQPWLTTTKYRWRVIVDKIENLSNLHDSGQISGQITGLTIGLFTLLLSLIGACVTVIVNFRRFWYWWRSRRSARLGSARSEDLYIESLPIGLGEIELSTAPFHTLMSGSLHREESDTNSNSEHAVNQKSHLARNTPHPALVSTLSTDSDRCLEVLVPMEVLPSAASGCGRFVQALSASLSFTIGGMFLIDDVAFGLTTQHSLRDMVESMRDENKEAMRRDKRGGTVHTANLAEGGSTQQQRQQTVISEPAVTEEKRRVIMPPINMRQDDTRSQLDWSLIAFDDEEIRDLGNTIFVPNQFRSISISSVVPTSEFEDNEVLITAGKSGLAYGWLRSSPISMQTQNGVVEARQIILERPLVPGDSGSWVLKDEKLYGHIFARRTLSPIAYMLPIESILKDIRWCLNAKSIKLVGGDEIYENNSRCVCEDVKIEQGYDE